MGAAWRACVGGPPPWPPLPVACPCSAAPCGLRSGQKRKPAAFAIGSGLRGSPAPVARLAPGGAWSRPGLVRVGAWSCPPAGCAPSRGVAAGGSPPRGRSVCVSVRCLPPPGPAGGGIDCPPAGKRRAAGFGFRRLRAAGAGTIDGDPVRSVLRVVWTRLPRGLGSGPFRAAYKGMRRHKSAASRCGGLTESRRG